MEELNFLGYNISSDGFRPEKDKLKIVKDMQPPTSVKEIRQCLGFFNFYKFFIPNFSLYAGEMTKLTREKSTWKEGKLPEEAIDAFEHLKTAL